jgi:hypothetical protein
MNGNPNGDARSMLMNALAARAGIGTIDGQLPSPQEMLSQLAGADPTMALLAQYLSRESTESEASEPEEEAPLAAPAAPVPAQSAELIRAVRGLQRKAEQMFAELDTLRARNDLFAAALGACYLCWGDDSACEVCGGSGRPGSDMPDRELFAELVMPALRRIRTAPAPTTGRRNPT